VKNSHIAVQNKPKILNFHLLFKGVTQLSRRGGELSLGAEESGGGGLFSFFLFKFKVPDWEGKVNPMQESKNISRSGTIILTTSVLQKLQGGVVVFWGAHGGFMGAPTYSISNGT
jgi:hypothetical protein